MIFLFAITAAGDVPCGNPQKSNRISSIVQIIFFFWSFEICEGILRNQKIIIGLYSFSNYLVAFDTIRSLCKNNPVENYRIIVILFCSMLQTL